MLIGASAGNEFQSEALPGALPRGQNNPRVSKEAAQRCLVISAILPAIFQLGCPPPAPPAADTSH